MGEKGNSPAEEFQLRCKICHTGLRGNKTILGE
jgi:hypothetical protein